MTDTTFSEDCNSNPNRECTVSPMVHSEILAAAVDGGDMEIAALSILAHPASVHFPKDLVADLAKVVFAPEVPDERLQSRVAVASSFILKLEGVA